MLKLRLQLHFPFLIRLAYTVQEGNRGVEFRISRFMETVRYERGFAELNARLESIWAMPGRWSEMEGGGQACGEVADGCRNY